MEESELSSIRCRRAHESTIEGWLQTAANNASAIFQDNIWQAIPRRDAHQGGEIHSRSLTSAKKRDVSSTEDGVRDGQRRKYLHKAEGRRWELNSQIFI